MVDNEAMEVNYMKKCLILSICCMVGGLSATSSSPSSSGFKAVSGSSYAKSGVPTPGAVSSTQDVNQLVAQAVNTVRVREGKEPVDITKQVLFSRVCAGVDQRTDLTTDQKAAAKEVLRKQIMGTTWQETMSEAIEDITGQGLTLAEHVLHYVDLGASAFSAMDKLIDGQEGLESRMLAIYGQYQDNPENAPWAELNAEEVAYLVGLYQNQSSQAGVVSAKGSVPAKGFNIHRVGRR